MSTICSGLIEARMFLAMAASGPEVAMEEVIDQVAQSVAFLVSRGTKRRR